jgi:hypothetical protein
MSNPEQLRARTLALFHSLVSNWANELRKDMTLIQDGVLRQLDALQERVAQYEENMDEGAVLAFVDEIQRGAGADGSDGNMLGRLRESMSRLEHGGSLTEVLTQLVDEANDLAPRCAMFILKGGNCVGWYARGFDQSPGFSNDSVKKISVPANADTVFRAVIKSRQSFLGESNAHRDNVQLLSRIGNVLPTSIFAIPLILRDKIAAILYADSGDSREPFTGNDGIAILVGYASKVIDLLSVSKARTTGELTGPREVASSPGREMSSSPSLNVRAELGVGPSPLRQPTPGPSPPLAPPLGPRPVEVPSAVPRVSPGPVSPGPVDLETRKQHEDAKRFARLLVSEIKLYREAEVQQGRKNRDLYDRLKDDIDRSRQLYFERVPSAVRSQSDYFNEELVRILADGDSGALGGALPS